MGGLDNLVYDCDRIHRIRGVIGAWNDAISMSTARHGYVWISVTSTPKSQRSYFSENLVNAITKKGSHLRLKTMPLVHLIEISRRVLILVTLTSKSKYNPRECLVLLEICKRVLLLLLLLFSLPTVIEYLLIGVIWLLGAFSVLL